ncbi:MAG: transketolase [Candidatus Omnitrophica bacterium]|nr:transketolase [Candidatus Omnitrophota bacterium]
MNTFSHLEHKAQLLRRTVLRMCIGAGTGHVTSSFSCVELLVALYYGGILRHDPKNPGWENRDRFILSKGQASPILYAVLCDRGFFPKTWLKTFCKKNGRFGVHLQHDVPGVEVTTGSLGYGLGIGAGMALAARLNRQPFLIFVLLGDGECHEGSVWETAMFAGHQELNNLVAIVDRNWLCATDFTENCVRLNPLERKWRAFGWDVRSIDGHSFPHIFKALSGLRLRERNQPLAIIANTVKGKGIDFMENQPLWHGIAPQGKEAREALACLKKIIRTEKKGENDINYNA